MFEERLKDRMLGSSPGSKSKGTCMNFDDQPENEVVPGYFARMLHSENMTFVSWRILKDAVLPEHSHMHEQVANILEGQFQLTISGETKIYGPGSIVVIPSHAVHSGISITDSRILDTFSPVRQDYKDKY